MGAAGHPITRVSVGPGGVQANSYSRYPKISADGRYVAFWSCASNLVPSDVNQQSDVFRYDRATGDTVLMSLGQLGNQANG